MAAFDGWVHEVLIYAKVFKIETKIQLINTRSELLARHM